MTNTDKYNLLTFAEKYLGLSMNDMKYSFYSPNAKTLILYINLSKDKYSDNIVSFTLEHEILAYEDETKNIIIDITPQWLRHKENCIENPEM